MKILISLLLLSFVFLANGESTNTSVQHNCAQMMSSADSMDHISTHIHSQCAQCLAIDGVDIFLKSFSLKAIVLPSMADVIYTSVVSKVVVPPPVA